LFRCRPDGVLLRLLDVVEIRGFAGLAAAVAFSLGFRRLILRMSSLLYRSPVAVEEIGGPWFERRGGFTFLSLGGNGCFFFVRVHLVVALLFRGGHAISDGFIHISCLFGRHGQYRTGEMSMLLVLFLVR
jgi:hypothetical protein